MDASMSDRPRILILTTSYLPLIGGSELAIRNLTERMTEWDFDLVTGRHSPDLPVAEALGRVRVFRAGGRLSRLTMLLPKNLMPLPMALTAWRLMRKRKYALIQVYQASQAGGAAWILKLLYPKTPLLLTLQEGKELSRQGFLVRLFRRLIFWNADRITAISEYLAHYARARTRTPVELVPNGVDTALFSPGGDRQPGHVIISASRLVPKNGLEYLIKAMPVVINRFSDARLVLVGDGPLRSSLEEVVRSAGVGDAVRFVGAVSHGQLPQLLREADVFVRPSLSEGLGTAFLEAMAVGLPVVASDVGGIKDFLHDGDTGLVCDPTDSANIAMNIVRLFDDASLRSRLALQGRTLVVEQYGWDAIATAMNVVYNRVARR